VTGFLPSIVAEVSVALLLGIVVASIAACGSPRKGSFGSASSCSALA